jgi:hypothetical protein
MPSLKKDKSFSAFILKGKTATRFGAAAAIPGLHMNAVIMTRPLKISHNIA